MKKILIVEDDRIAANIYRNKFSVENYQVEVAQDGPTGLALIREFQPDAVILDLMLPNMSGVEVLKKLRSEPDLEKLPVFVFSNTYLTGMIQEAWKAGATKCLSKANCTPKQLLEVVQNTLSPGRDAVAPPAPDTAEAATPPDSTETAPCATPAQARNLEADAKFQAELRKTFLEGLPATLTALRALLQSLAKSGSETARLKQLEEMYRRVHALTGNAGLAEMSHFAQMTDALEVLLRALYEKPKTISASTLRTVALAVDFLRFLFDRGLSQLSSDCQPGTALVVDDEAISQRAVTYALEKARLKCTTVDHPVAALELLSQKEFDLVILDIDMPGMNGFELCTKLRALPQHKLTPVVFVTNLNDFDNRTNSSMSGGNDFIAKPFLFIELAVKALMYVIRGRLQSPK